MIVLRWLAMALLLPALPAGYLWILHVINAVDPQAAPFERRRAESVLSAARTPDALPVSGWQQVHLRDWNRPLSSRGVHAWYRLRFTTGVPRAALDTGGGWAVFVDQAYTRLTFHVTGAEIGTAGPDTGVEPVLRGPVWVPIPPALHRAGEDVLHVRSDSGVRHTSLDRIHIGPARVLRPAFERSHGVKRWLRDTSFAVMLSASLIFGLLAFLRRRDSFYVWSAGTVVGWTLCMLHRQFDIPPVHPGAWEAYGQASLGWFVLAGTMFTHRIVGRSAPRLERIVIGWAVVGPVLLCLAQVALALMPEADMPGRRIAIAINALVWLPTLLVAGLYMLALMSHRLAAGPDLETALFWAIAAIIFGVAAHDYVTYFLWISPGSPQFLSFTSLALLVGLAAIVLRRFAGALADAESLNRELEERVAEKAGEIELHLGRAKDLERERALASERERITRDMHDGLGGQLVAALALSASVEHRSLLHETLEASLQELRLLIDSAEPTDGDLLSVLGMLRMRSARRLEAAGIRVDWQVCELPPLQGLEPHRVLQVMRILQEALTNVLKHAGATRISVHTGTENVDGGTWVRIDVADDGKGLAADTTAGRGLANMRRRAGELGGKVELRNLAEVGCMLSLWLPVRHPDLP